jgi:hypothetical protein
MKSLLLASLFVVSSTAMAMPNIGDKVVLTGTANGTPASLESELVAANSTKTIYTRQNKTTINGETQTENEEVKAEDLVTDESINTVMTLCETEMINGKLESITVAAGTFDTCKIGSDGAELNIGRVPFGVVRIASPEVTLELQSYNIAQ